MKKIPRIITILAVLLVFTILVKHTTYAQTDTSVLESFKYKYDLYVNNISVPTIVELKMPEEIKNNKNIAILENNTKSFQPYTILAKQVNTPYTIVSNLGQPDETFMYDSNITTYAEYNLITGGSNEITWTITYDKPISTNTFNFSMDKFVQYPTNITIEASSPQRKVLVDNAEVKNVRMSFPQTTAQTWLVTMKYTQPLRITEMGFEEFPVNNIQQNYIRFLARVGMTYALYTEPDKSVYINTGESGNLNNSNDAIQNILLPAKKLNTLYKPADIDKDGILDSLDNCPNIVNTDQKDINKNNIGDACEDFDHDGILNIKDNCPEYPNSMQQDKDGDGIGDHCDGKESRLTEQLFFLPWLGIGIGFAVVLLLFKTTQSKS
ncbi:hypothetical protein COV24_01240 [candidate division WWE3 bacterium CG10_big_fil_rev_8_21_14_0_10_32_10]|uniref:Thrombospondin n=1 Tax=candidate division WWE3 bacterium CG10_big_fil_rev_8_21_14_0_10_32_10 TaxID=1975090 RepID=A0A2H0RAV3_UNCKA|nr:MAG: hypothetical protein COV24_01240 [candidate division WWE3 bacterium CG10_big_fil_rev_8_21_14_0_10_32_10]